MLVLCSTQYAAAAERRRVKQPRESHERTPRTARSGIKPLKDTPVKGSTDQTVAQPSAMASLTPSESSASVKGEAEDAVRTPRSNDVGGDATRRGDAIATGETSKEKIGVCMAAIDERVEDAGQAPATRRGLSRDVEMLELKMDLRPSPLDAFWQKDASSEKLMTIKSEAFIFAQVPGLFTLHTLVSSLKPGE